MRLHNTYYNISEISTEFLRNEITRIRKEWNTCTPARTLYDICVTIAKSYAKQQNDSAPHLARLDATDWGKTITVYPVFHCRPVEDILTEMNFKSNICGSDIYWWPAGKVSSKTVQKWMSDNFYGTMENPNI